MKKIGWLLALPLILISGCTSQSNTPTQQNAPSSIALQFEVKPANPTPEQPVTLTTKVTGNNKPVNDANVEFEVWHSEAKNHSMLKSTRTGDGTYSITNTYPMAGKYNVVIHATTPKVHQMISKTFTIGEAKTNRHEHQTDGTGLMLHIQLPATAKSGQNTKIYGHVAQNNKPLTNANVQYEIWKEGTTNHDFTDVAETNPGEYYSSYHFKTPGTYHIKLHVEKGEIHDHTEQKLVVK